MTKDTDCLVREWNNVTLVRFDHYLPKLFPLEIDIAPLKRHHVNNTKTAGMESKEEHLKVFLTARFRTGFIILHKGFHFIFGKALPVKSTFKTLLCQRKLSDHTHILDPQIDGRVDKIQVACIRTSLENRSQGMVDGCVAVLFNIPSPFNVCINQLRGDIPNIDGIRSIGS